MFSNWNFTKHSVTFETSGGFEYSARTTACVEEFHYAIGTAPTSGRLVWRPCTGNGLDRDERGIAHSNCLVRRDLKVVLFIQFAIKRVKSRYLSFGNSLGLEMSGR